MVAWMLWLVIIMKMRYVMMGHVTIMIQVVDVMSQLPQKTQIVMEIAQKVTFQQMGLVLQWLRVVWIQQHLITTRLQIQMMVHVSKLQRVVQIQKPLIMILLRMQMMVLVQIYLIYYMWVDYSIALTQVATATIAMTTGIQQVLCLQEGLDKLEKMTDQNFLVFILKLQMEHLSQLKIGQIIQRGNPLLYHIKMKFISL